MYNELFIISEVLKNDIKYPLIAHLVPKIVEFDKLGDVFIDTSTKSF